jgi:hypothetical protein
MASGEMTEGEFTDFLRALLQNAADVSRAGALAFICMRPRLGLNSHKTEAGGPDRQQSGQRHPSSWLTFV